MNKKEFQETEEALRAYFRKGRIENPQDYPEFQPDFEDIKRRMAEIESGKRMIPPLSPTPEEWNRMVWAERLQMARKIVSIAACAVAAVGVVGGAYWFGRESIAAPNPDSSSIAGTSSVWEESATVSEGSVSSADDTSGIRLPEGTVSYEEAVRLTGLPLKKADDMDGFKGYVIDGNQVHYKFTQGLIYIQKTDISNVDSFSAQVYNSDGKTYYIQVLDDVIRVQYNSPDEESICFLGVFSNLTTNEVVQMLNVIVF